MSTVSKGWRYSGTLPKLSKIDKTKWEPLGIQWYILKQRIRAAWNRKPVCKYLGEETTSSRWSTRDWNTGPSNVLVVVYNGKYIYIYRRWHTYRLKRLGIEDFLLVVVSWQLYSEGSLQWSRLQSHWPPSSAMFNHSFKSILIYTSKRLINITWYSWAF